MNMRPQPLTTRIYELRLVGADELSKSDSETTLFDLPIAFSGTVKQIAAWVQQHELRWVKTNELFGGHYVAADGTAYLPC